jgi:regulator of sirC expression with transglutaminase-like and TPR domain
LERLLSGLIGGEAEVRPEYLAPASRRAILTRVLYNLKNLYYRNGDFGRALTAAERILLLNPDAAPELRDRGLLHRLMGHTEAAAHDLSEYLALAPDAPDAERIREILGDASPDPEG